MSIVHWLPDVPDGGTIVHARGRSERFRDHPAQHVERCVYRDGKFCAGGDFPIPSFELHDVDAWVYETDMSNASHLRGFTGHDAETLIESEPV